MAATGESSKLIRRLPRHLHLRLVLILLDAPVQRATDSNLGSPLTIFFSWVGSFDDCGKSTPVVSIALLYALLGIRNHVESEILLVGLNY